MAGNFDRATNLHPHPNPTDFAHEICIRDADIGWLRHIPSSEKFCMIKRYNMHILHMTLGEFTTKITQRDNSTVPTISTTKFPDFLYYSRPISIAASTFIFLCIRHLPLTDIPNCPQTE